MTEAAASRCGRCWRSPSLRCAFGVAACGDDDEQRQRQHLRPSRRPRPATSSSTTSRRQDRRSTARRLTIGSKNFTEQHVLGEIYSQALEAAGYKIKKELNLGSEQIALKALKQGKIDAYPEYTGTALTSFFGVKTEGHPEGRAAGLRADSKTSFAKNGITALAPTPFTNSNEVGMTEEEGRASSASTKISDLAGKAQGPDALRLARSAASASTACSGSSRSTG